jgi:imidazolonepropionase-like amidohydrolase
MKKLIAILCLILNFASLVFAQDYNPVNGLRDPRPEAYAFTNATIFIDYKTKLENATLFIRQGKVEAVGLQLNLPSDIEIIDLKGKYIYPSFIDLYTNYGLPEVKSTNSTPGPPQIESKIKGAYHWNEAIKSTYNASENFKADQGAAEALRKLGFGTVLSHNHDGIARGSSVLVTLGNEKENMVVLNEKVAAHYSFHKGSSKQDYPNSLMGAIALLRQTYLDAIWYQSPKHQDAKNLSFEAWNNLQSLPQIFEVNDKLSLFRADKVGDEFGVQYIIKGSGKEYQNIKDVKQTKAPLILPINYPKPKDVEDPFDAMMVSLEEMKHWELAPTNLAAVANQNIPFTLTTHGLETKDTFWVNLRKAIDAGLAESQALKALTFTPAQLIKMGDAIGCLKNGYLANFIITSGNIFDKETIIYENWIKGKRHLIQEAKDDVLKKGIYALKAGNQDLKLKVQGTPVKPEYKLVFQDTVEQDIKVNITRNLININIKHPKDSFNIHLSGYIQNNNLKGNGQLPDGNWFSWQAKWEKDLGQENPKEKTEKAKNEIQSKVTYPFLPYGFETRPEQGTLLFKNATVWTNEKEGILEHTDVLVKNGKIAAIGKGLSAKDAKIIDATGKHLTSGIIDEHSHIAISRGVNEGSQAVTAEVRIGDVINSEDINIYRQLAGGVTAAQLLHGSANPIGGQSALIKLRWGASPEEMKIKGADGFIKFALGENVKQSNWGQFYTIRYPQSRMGVEQVFYEAFTRAKEYEKEWKHYHSLSKKQKAQTPPPRKDLELEALVEILNEKRFISCHSYVQSEINMLMKAADELGFKINTFTHILEGYKLADKMQKRNIGGSTFADWWAFKFEVREAVPYNAALMNGEGVVTAINSDDAEMGRRLNQEAAKTIKYGSVSPEEAWKMVTLNPAKLLHLDDKMGSIKAGKDADLVLWSQDPLSIYAKAEKTLVDGIVYYDMENDLKMRETIRNEKNRLMAKMKETKLNGEQCEKPQPKEEHHWHCEDILEHY